MINSIFRYTRADEVAECWDGITPDLYEALWAIVSVMKLIPNTEDSGPHDHVGHENLAKYWRRLSVEHRRQLNILAAKRNQEYSKW